MISGTAFQAATAVDHEERVVDVGPDARPKLVRDAAGRLTVAWSYFKDKEWNAQVLVASSTDGRRNFTPPPQPGSGKPKV